MVVESSMGPVDGEFLNGRVLSMHIGSGDLFPVAPKLAVLGMVDFGIWVVCYEKHLCGKVVLEVENEWVFGPMSFSRERFFMDFQTVALLFWVVSRRVVLELFPPILRYANSRLYLYI